jgi:sirohydrochlorin ferrochelatase
VTLPLVIAAHGSADPRFALTVEAIAARVRRSRPGLDVSVGYLDHGPPHLSDAVSPSTVVVPLLLSSGYHVLADLPAQATGAHLGVAVGPDPRLADVLAERLAEAGYDGRVPVTLAAAGSSDERALADVRLAARQLAGKLGAEVTAAFVSAGEPRVADLRPAVIASYLVAPGAFHDALGRVGAGVVSEPVGDHPAVAELVLTRYDDVLAQTPGRTAPA